jgi:hypothetical protein
MNDSISTENSVIQSIYFLKSLIFCKYDNFEYIFLLIISFVISSIIYVNICKCDECLSVLTLINREFLEWCLTSIDQNQKFIIFL